MKWITRARPKTARPATLLLACWVWCAWVILRDCKCSGLWSVRARPEISGLDQGPRYLLTTA